MSTKVTNISGECQTATSDSDTSAQSARADLVAWLADLAEAMRRTNWTPEALDAHWGTSRGYAWRLCNGEKSWSVERMLSLPDDLEAQLEHLRAERFGRVVVAPVSQEDGMRQLICGLASLLAPQRSALPSKFSTALKVETPLRRATDRQRVG